MSTFPYSMPPCIVSSCKETEAFVDPNHKHDACNTFQTILRCDFHTYSPVSFFSHLMLHSVRLITDN